MDGREDCAMLFCLASSNQRILPEISDVTCKAMQWYALARDLARGGVCAKISQISEPR